MHWLLQSAETPSVLEDAGYKGLYQDYQNGPGQWLNNLYFFNEDNLPPEPEPLPQPEQAQTRRKPILPPLPAAILNSLPPGYRELLLETQGGRPPGPPQPGAPNR